MRIASGVIDKVIYFVAVDGTNFTSREPGLSAFTVYRSRNNSAPVAMTTPTVTELDATNMPGVYSLLLDEDMSIGAGNDTEEMVFHITHAGMAPVTRTIELYRPKITLGNTLGVAADGDLLEVNALTGHTAQSGDSFARLGAPSGASVVADISTRMPTTHIAATAGKVDGVALVDVTTTNTDMRGTDGANTVVPLDAAGVRTALGLAAANLDVQLDTLPTAAEIVTAVLNTQMTESYAANGVAPTLAQAQFAVHQMLMQFGIVGTNVTVRRLDDTTTAFVVTLDSASAPTDAKRI